MADTIFCPNCQCVIEVTEVLSAQLRSELRTEFEIEAKRRDAALKERELELVRAAEKNARDREAIDEEIRGRLLKERERIRAESLQKAKEEMDLELEAARHELAEARNKLKTAQKIELELRAERQRLEEDKERMALEVQRKLDEERAKIRDDARKQAEEERRLKDAEKDKLIGDLKLQIEELRRKSEQGSQQLQGEVMEIALEEQLRREFPQDAITPVPKGIHGGDVVQVIRDGSGLECGRILWESKRTKNWNDAWLAKLRDDQRAAKAEAAVLVSAELPKDVCGFRRIEGIWATDWNCAWALASALRIGILEAAAARRAHEGRQGKMEFLYGYLSGPEFRQRIEGIVEAYVSLQKELEAEKRAMQRVWAKREKQLRRALDNTAGFYGDLQGIVGRAMPVIESLEFPALAEGEESLEEAIES